MKSEKMWNQLAKSWDKPGVSLGENDLKIIEMTKKYLNPSSVVLDYGCATGSIALEIAGIAKEVHGIDISSNMIEIAKRKGDERNIKKIGFAQAAIFEESLGKGLFDVILSLRILHLVEDSAQVLDRVNQLLKPGGIFISATPCLGEKTFLSVLTNIPIFLLSRVGVIPSITFFSASSLTAAITNAGFQMIEQKDLSVRPLRICFIVARKGWKAENHASSSLVVPDAHRHVVQGYKKAMWSLRWNIATNPDKALRPTAQRFAPGTLPNKRMRIPLIHGFHQMHTSKKEGL